MHYLGSELNGFNETATQKEVRSRGEKYTYEHSCMRLYVLPNWYVLPNFYECSYVQFYVIPNLYMCLSVLPNLHVGFYVLPNLHVGLYVLPNLYVRSYVRFYITLQNTQYNSK